MIAKPIVLAFIGGVLYCAGIVTGAVMMFLLVLGGGAV